MEKNNFSFAKIAAYIKLFVIALLFGSLFVPFGTGMKMIVKSSGGNVVTTYRPAFSFMFGGKLVSEHISYQSQGKCVIAIIGYIFVIIAIVLLLVSLFSQKNHNIRSRILLFVSFAAILTASILMLCSHQSASTILADAIIGEHSDAVANTIYKNTSIGFGFWGISLFGFISSFGLLVSLFFDGTIDLFRQFISSKILNEK